MANIEITMKDGTIKRFLHKGRPGGSYTKRITFEGGFAVVRDEYDVRTAIPSNDILEVVERPHE